MQAGACVRDLPAVRRRDRRRVFEGADSAAGPGAEGAGALFFGCIWGKKLAKFLKKEGVLTGFVGTNFFSEIFLSRQFPP